MNRSHGPTPDSNLDRLVAAGGDMIRAWRPDFQGRWLLVDVISQRLLLLHGMTAAGGWPVSTSAAGLDNRQDSAGTPPGLHRIGRKIGTNAELGTIFESRRSTGILWRRNHPEKSEAPEGDLILTRILTLNGLEDGLNLGAGIDSRARYIYIHGTNHEEAIGLPESGGCVRMTNLDVVELFDQVEEGDPVVIL